jgi:hypothetical protein
VGEACGTNEGEEERVWVIGRKTRRKVSTRKTRYRWMDNNKLDLAEIGLDGMD